MYAVREGLTAKRNPGGATAGERKEREEERGSIVGNCRVLDQRLLMSIMKPPVAGHISRVVCEIPENLTFAPKPFPKFVSKSSKPRGFDEMEVPGVAEPLKPRGFNGMEVFGEAEPSKPRGFNDFEIGSGAGSWDCELWGLHVGCWDCEGLAL